jgi:hypothetical protein
VPNPIYEVLMADIWLQLKLLFMALAGVNLLFFYLSGRLPKSTVWGQAGRAAPGEGDRGASLILWLGVVYFGRLIPWAL